MRVSMLWVFTYVSADVYAESLCKRAYDIHW